LSPDQVLWGITGTLGGVICSIMLAIMLHWVRKGEAVGEKAAALSAKVSSLQVSIEFLRDDILEMARESKEQWRIVDHRMESLPCHRTCGPEGTGHKGDPRGTAEANP